MCKGAPLSQDEDVVHELQQCGVQTADSRPDNIVQLFRILEQHQAAAPEQQGASPSSRYVMFEVTLAMTTCSVESIQVQLHSCCMIAVLTYLCENGWQSHHLCLITGVTLCWLKLVQAVVSVTWLHGADLNIWTTGRHKILLSGTRHLLTWGLKGYSMPQLPLLWR